MTDLVEPADVVITLKVSFPSGLRGDRGACRNKKKGPTFSNISADLSCWSQLIIPIEALYGITIMMVKFSILLFYVRLFGTVASFVLYVRVAMAIIFCWMVSVVLETFLLCRPLAFNWDTTVPGGVCGDRNAAYIVAGALNVGTDLLVMLLPMPNIWKLQMPVSQRVGLVGVFGIGFL